jgi:hypothetical protein
MINSSTLKKTAFYKKFNEIIAAVFILLFVYTAVSKLSDLQKFKATLVSSPLLSSVAKPISIGIPILELAIAALLFFPGTRRWGLAASLLMMIVFTCYIAYMLLFTSRLPCSCGGVIGELSWTQHLALNLVLTSLAAAAVYMEAKIFIAINRGSRKPVNRVGINFK